MCRVIADCVSMNAKEWPCEGVIELPVLHVTETWGIRCAERRKVKALEMKCLTCLVGVWNVNVC